MTHRSLLLTPVAGMENCKQSCDAIMSDLIEVCDNIQSDPMYSNYVDLALGGGANFHFSIGNIIIKPLPPPPHPTPQQRFLHPLPLDC